MTISLRMNDKEEALIREYAKAKNISVSSLFRESVLEKIEDEIDIELYDKAMAEHLKEDQSISFEDMMNELDIEA
ncbi:MAG: DUF6290 family protein [Alkalibacterium thalassium]|uniref:Ribbon-helix-helix protein, copG family n=1 Tax=Alkalibacterium pelagium TaxID=426702 RepID=A0A1H7ICB2_9LACT|nr:DUF6290 family protein [Alkalibacterium pelagium]MCD8506154.1 DUF6290 family protein [Alkalibacterium thalassium]GEN50039.1 hypothetical protein APE02nite_07040 [Alkalibacterium pelagium]SEK60203.1 hypothetical protein SAMN04488099_10485 [Alkalibacterium pelagium]